MSIRDALKGVFGLESEQYPTFEFRGSTWHFNPHTAGDESWAAAQAGLTALTNTERGIIQTKLIVLSSIVKMVDSKGAVSYPWREFIDTENVPSDLKSLVEAAKETPEAPPKEVRRAGALGFMKYLDAQPAGIMRELDEFYTDRIVPLGLSSNLVRYVCMDCAETRPDYEHPIISPRDEPPFCQYCGKQTVEQDVVRVATGGGDPLA